MDLITVILVVGSLANGVLLTLALRHARGAELSAARCEEQLGLANEVLPKLLNATSVAIAALPKKRKPRAKAKAEVEVVFP